MVSTHYEGRLGNNLFQYCIARYFAEKNNLPLVTPPINDNYVEPPHSLDFSSLLKPRSYDQLVNYPIAFINDNNALHFLKNIATPDVNYVFRGYFQTREIVLHCYENLRNLFVPYTGSKMKNSLLVLVRLNDIANSGRNLPLSYYESAIEQASFDNGYITSDSPDHEFVTHLMNKYNLKLYEPGGDKPLQKEGINRYPKYNMNAILFGRNFESIVTSGGSFNFWTALLSEANNVFVPEYKQGVWYGDIFCLPEWKVVSYK